MVIPHKEDGPEIGSAESGFLAINNVETVLVPHGLVAEQVTLPVTLFPATVVEIAEVPCPDAMVTPTGTVQV